jgi:hypothetical protein
MWYPAPIPPHLPFDPKEAAEHGAPMLRPPVFTVLLQLVVQISNCPSRISTTSISSRSRERADTRHRLVDCRRRDDDTVSMRSSNASYCTVQYRDPPRRTVWPSARKQPEQKKGSARGSRSLSHVLHCFSSSCIANRDRAGVDITRRVPSHIPRLYGRGVVIGQGVDVYPSLDSFFVFFFSPSSSSIRSTLSHPFLYTPVRCGDNPPTMSQAPETPTSTSEPPRRTHCHVDSEAAAPANVDYMSGDPEAEAEAVDMNDLVDHDQTRTTAIIAIAKSWRAHASLLMLFVRHPLFPL